MPKTHALVLLACLAACASNPVQPSWTKPTWTGSLPATPAEPAMGEEGAPKDTSLPIGVGLTTGPSTILVAGTLDFPIDKKLTFGPSLLYGFDDNVDLVAVTGQLKYFLPIVENSSGFSILPYVTGGVGVASLDKQGRSGDTGLLLDLGAGVRYLTGEHYRVGSEVRWNLMPDDLAGESNFFSFELLQIVIDF
ncbi:MAG TPA: hypothetical protein VFZ65_12100 [Planctomycetota bacterium]|nr:hypothetical protein [Planctomycetota bacterium]